MVGSKTSRFGEVESMSCKKCVYKEEERQELIEGGINPCVQCPVRSEEFLESYLRRKKNGMERIRKRK